MKSAIINTNATIALKQLIRSAEVDDNTIIQVFKNGRLIASDKWYSDAILDEREQRGIATKAGTGHTITFKI